MAKMNPNSYSEGSAAMRTRQNRAKKNQVSEWNQRSTKFINRSTRVLGGNGRGAKRK